VNARERGFLLLTGTLGDPQRRCLTTAQLRQLTQRMSLVQRQKDPRPLEAADLLALGYGRDMAMRILDLLNQEDVLTHYLFRARKAGCVPITRVSPGYPVLLRSRLGGESPGCLWARGDVSLLERPAIALVGSRDLRPRNREFAREAGRQAALQGFVLVSGNARGADREAQEACLGAGGQVISVVADALTGQKVREGMLFLSEDGFDEPFSAQRAISRNRVIHALGWRTLVAQTAHGTGGTWNGTVKNLHHGYSGVACFDDGSEAVKALQDLGAMAVSMQMLADFATLAPAEQNLFDME